MNQHDEQTLNQRIRERAYRLWEDEGRPDGRADDHWDRATELVAIEDSAPPRLKVVAEGPTGEPVEPIEALENQGEFPTMVDQGEQQIPERRAEGHRGRG